MARLKRIMVRLSLPMEEALSLLAEREGRPEATIAAERLRTALARTIEGAECVERIATRRAQSTRDDWAFDQAVTAEELRHGTA